MSFYERVISQLLATAELKRSDSVLAVCAGKTDRDVLMKFGFENATISNLDEELSEPGAFGPYPWAHADVEELPFADESFDSVIVHAGLHHCRSPHRGLLEMYRVARKQDSWSKRETVH
jgi:ubiquinone/menaquinone biosynthesis C-methylase UbiE